MELVYSERVVVTCGLRLIMSVINDSDTLLRRCIDVQQVRFGLM